MIARICALVLPILLAACAAPGGDARYGEPVRFAPSSDLVFPDFRLRYVGERRVNSPVFRPGFTFHDFRVTAPGGAAQTVSWSSGTGVIDATDFTVDGRGYALELRGSVGPKKWLRDDELIVWRAEDYRRAMERR